MHPPSRYRFAACQRHPPGSKGEGSHRRLILLPCVLCRVQTFTDAICLRLQEWVQRYHTNRDAATAELLTLLVKVSLPSAHLHGAMAPTARYICRLVFIMHGCMHRFHAQAVKTPGISTRLSNLGTLLLAVCRCLVNHLIPPVLLPHATKAPPHAALQCLRLKALTLQPHNTATLADPHHPLPPHNCMFSQLAALSLSLWMMWRGARWTKWCRVWHSASPR